MHRSMAGSACSPCLWPLEHLRQEKGKGEPPEEGV